MAGPIMPKGTAVWLIENTALTFEQIANFCGMHVLEVQALADEQGTVGIVGVNPIKLGQLTQEEIDRCTQDPNSALNMTISTISEKKKTRKKYTPLIKRQERPDAVAWLIKYYPDMPDSTIAALISATKNTIISIREKLHMRGTELRPRDPVLLGFCSQMELDRAVNELKKSSEHQGEQ